MWGQGFPIQREPQMSQYMYGGNLAPPYSRAPKLLLFFKWCKISSIDSNILSLIRTTPKSAPCLMETLAQLAILGPKIRS